MSKDTKIVIDIDRIIVVRRLILLTIAILPIIYLIYIDLFDPNMRPPHILSDSIFTTIFTRALCIFCIIVIGFMLVNFFYMLFSRKSKIVVDNLGISDHSSLLALGLIPWSEIQSISVKRQVIRAQKLGRYLFTEYGYLALKLRYNESFVAHLPSWKRWLLSLKSKSIDNTVNISFLFAKVEPESVFPDILELYKKHRY